MEGGREGGREGKRERGREGGGREEGGREPLLETPALLPHLRLPVSTRRQAQLVLQWLRMRSMKAVGNEARGVTMVHTACIGLQRLRGAVLFGISGTTD